MNSLKSLMSCSPVSSTSMDIHTISKMGKKKGKNRLRNLNKQPQQEDGGMKEDPPVEIAVKTDDSVNKMTNLTETATNESNSIDVGSKLESNTSTSEAVKEGLTPLSETVPVKNCSEECTNSKSTECLSSIGNSAITNDSTSSNCEELKRDEIQSFPRTKSSLSDGSEQETIMRDPLLTTKESEIKVKATESNVQTVEIEQESTVRDSNLKRENKCLTPLNEISDIQNSVQESVIGESKKLSDPDIKTSLEGSSKTIEMNVNKIASVLETGGLNLAAAGIEKESTSTDTNLETKNECSLSSDEAISINNISSESDFEMKSKLSESTAENFAEPNNLVSSKDKESDGNVITKINEISAKDSNLEESEKKSIIRDSRGAENKRLNEMVKNENSLEEKEFSNSTNVAKEDAIIPAKMEEKQDLPANQPELKEEVLPNKNGKKSTVPKSKSAEDKIPSKQDSKKTNKRNKKSGLNKSKTTLENSLNNEDNVQLHPNLDKQTTIQEDSLLHKSDDNQGKDTLFQLGIENSTSPDNQIVNVEPSLDESIRTSILDTSKGNDVTGTERLDILGDSVLPSKEITLCQEGQDTNILTNTSSIKNHESLENITEDKNRVQNKTENCPIDIPTSQMIDNQTVEEGKPNNCGENKLEENIHKYTGSSEEATSNVTDADKILQVLGKEQQVKYDANSNCSATDAEFKGSETDLENNLPLEVTIAMENINEPETLTKAEGLKPENSKVDTTSLLKMHNDSHEVASVAESNKEEHQETITTDSNTEELIPPANKEDLEGKEPMPSNDREKEESIGKNSRPKNGKNIDKEKPELSIEEQLHPEKEVSDLKNTNTTNVNISDSFANNNMDTILSKKKSRSHKRQKNEEKGYTQQNKKTDGNISCEAKAKNENKNAIPSTTSKQGSESKQSKNKSKSASNSANVKKADGNGITADSSKVISNAEKSNTSNIANTLVVKNDSTDEKQLPHDESMKESSLLHADGPFETFPVRTIFMANTCHVCKLTHGGATRLKSCSACRLIAYCSKEHQKNHWKEHKSICQQVQKKIKQSNLQDLYGNACKITDPEEWRIYRCFQLSEIEKLIGRPLLPYEREMFLYPRVCSMCRKSDPEKLKVCKQCHYINYCCSEHIPKTHHNWCKELKLLLEINQYQSSNGLIKPRIPLINLDRTKQFPKDMKDFISASLSMEKNTKTYRLYESALSDVASYPLTILYVLEYLRKQNVKSSVSSNKLTIHVVGAESQFEVDTLSKWDAFLLNLLPNVSELHLVFIGPELMPSDTSEMNDNRCTKMLCKSLDPTKKFLTEFHYGKLYHEYVKESTFAKPDMICAFNCGIYRFTGFDNQDTWGPTISSMVKYEYTPIVLTAYTEVEAPKDVERFEKECSVQVVMPPSKNPFASMKPNLNFVSDDETPLIYKNQYLSVLQGDSKLQK